MLQPAPPPTAPAQVAVTLDNLGTEDRTFPPTAEFAASANLTAEAYARAAADPEAFWAEQANRLSWATPFKQVLDWSDAPHAKWFADGTLNVAYNCVDRHVEDGYGDTVAIHWEGEPGDSHHHLRPDLQGEVSKAANALISLGLKAGDRVAIYLPMIPEARLLDAGLRPAGARPRGGLRRVLGRGAAHQDRRRPGPAGDHRRRAVPARLRRVAESRCRRSGLGRRLTGRARAGGPPHRLSTSPGPTGTCGGTSWSTPSPISTPRRRSPPSSRCSSSTPRAPPGSPRASCTPPAAT